MKVLLFLWTVTAACLASAQETSAKAFLMGKWKVDMLNSEVPLTVSPERLEMGQQALREMWFLFRPDGSFTVFTDKKYNGRWRLAGNKATVQMKGTSDLSFVLQREAKRLRYDFKIDAGNVRLVLNKA